MRNQQKQQNQLYQQNNLKCLKKNQYHIVFTVLLYSLVRLFPQRFLLSNKNLTKLNHYKTTDVIGSETSYQFLKNCNK